MIGFNAEYETHRISDEDAFYRKMKLKRRLHRIVGEMYIGKRSKLKYFRNWLSALKMPPGAKILEVGSGDGLFSFVTADDLPSADVTGLELNAIEARVCNRLAGEEGVRNLRFVEGVLGKFAWAREFDLVYCLDVLEHIQDDVAVMRQMLEALKPGGTLLVHVTHRTFLNTDGTVSVVSDEDAWQVNPGHVRHGYTTAQLVEKLRLAGFTQIRCKRVSGWHIARALEIHSKNQSSIRRLLILPILDYRHRRDVRTEQPDGNTVWAWAQRP